MPLTLWFPGATIAIVEQRSHILPLMSLATGHDCLLQFWLLLMAAYWWLFMVCLFLLMVTLGDFCK